jgi:hypothetical protein
MVKSQGFYFHGSGSLDWRIVYGAGGVVEAAARTIDDGSG